MPLELHGVEGDEGAEVTVKLCVPQVTEAPVLREDGFIGAVEIAVRAVVGQVRPVMSLHLRLAAKDGGAGVVATRYRFDPVLLGDMFHEVFPLGAAERTTLLETCQRRGV